MAIRGESTGTNQILLDARFHAAAVSADSKTKHLGEPVKKGMTLLKTKRNVAEDHAEGRMDGLAVLIRGDVDLDEGVEDLEIDVYKAAGKDRNSSLYKGIFRMKLAKLLKLRGVAETSEVRALLDRLKEKLPVLWKTHAPDLLVKCKTVDELEAASHAADATAGRFFGDEVVARKELVETLRKSEGALTVIYPGKRKRVRSYFRQTGRKGTKKKDGNGGTP